MLLHLVIVRQNCRRFPDNPFHLVINIFVAAKLCKQLYGEVHEDHTANIPAVSGISSSDARGKSGTWSGPEVTADPSSRTFNKRVCYKKSNAFSEYVTGLVDYNAQKLTAKKLFCELRSLCEHLTGSTKTSLSGHEFLLRFHSVCKQARQSSASPNRKCLVRVVIV